MTEDRLWRFVALLRFTWTPTVASTSDHDHGPDTVLATVRTRCRRGPCPSDQRRRSAQLPVDGPDRGGERFRLGWRCDRRGGVDPRDRGLVPLLAGSLQCLRVRALLRMPSPGGEIRGGAAREADGRRSGAVGRRCCCVLGRDTHAGDESRRARCISWVVRESPGQSPLLEAALAVEQRPQSDTHRRLSHVTRGDRPGHGQEDHGAIDRVPYVAVEAIGA